MTWVRVTEEQARTHPLFGIKGWAALLAFGLAVGAIAGLVYAFGFEYVAKREITQLGKGYDRTPNELFEILKETPDFRSYRTKYLVITLGTFVISGISFLLLVARSQMFRRWFLWSSPFLLFGSTAILASIPGPAIEVVRALITDITFMATWGWYVAVSKRIRVTTLHDVTDTDQWLKILRLVDRPRATSDSRTPPLTVPNDISVPAQRMTRGAMTSAVIEPNLPLVPGGSVMPEVPGHSPVGGPLGSLDQKTHDALPINDPHLRSGMARAAAELASGNPDQGLWSLLLVNASGDHTKTRIAYLRERGQELAAAAKSDESSRAIAAREAAQRAEAEHQLLQRRERARAQVNAWRTFLEAGELDERQFKALVEALPFLGYSVRQKNSKGQGLLAYALAAGGAGMVEVALAAGAPVPLRVGKKSLGRWAMDAEPRVRTIVTARLLPPIEELVASTLSDAETARIIITVLRAQPTTVEEAIHVMRVLGGTVTTSDGRYRLAFPGRAPELSWSDHDVVTRIRSFVLGWVEELMAKEEHSEGTVAGVPVLTSTRSSDCDGSP